MARKQRSALIISDLRDHIYNYFQRSNSCRNYFFAKAHADDYAAYYTAMYLLQDSTEGLLMHRKKGFSKNPLLAYIEIWGVLQAIIIQQDAISTLYEALIKASPIIPAGSKWKIIRDFRNLCGGHPVNKGKDGNRERAFMGRAFGNYKKVKIEVWNQKKKKTEFREIELVNLIDEYSAEAANLLQDIVSLLPIKWP